MIFCQLTVHENFKEKLHIGNHSLFGVHYAQVVGIFTKAGRETDTLNHMCYR